MTRPKSTRPGPGTGGSSSGFTLIEVLVVVGVLTVILALGIPAIQNLIVRSKTEGFVRDASALMQRTRLEAIRMNREGAVFLDVANRRLVAFIDADRDGVFDPTGGTPRTVDYELSRLDLPSNVEFEDEAGNTGTASVLGNTTVEVDGADVPAPIFQPDGSIENPLADAFAYRVADVRGNVLEVRIAPAATGRVRVRKWQDSEWLSTVDPEAQDPKPWRWN
ncbi:MAG: prepilin-type N-terminal cleavage/methylation domain-containing protein [Thermoanaerobaculia bacterium]